jgi:hypothetical protein
MFMTIQIGIIGPSVSPTGALLFDSYSASVCA